MRWRVTPPLLAATALFALLATTSWAAVFLGQQLPAWGSALIPMAGHLILAAAGLAETLLALIDLAAAIWPLLLPQQLAAMQVDSTVLAVLASLVGALALGRRDRARATI